MSDLKPRIAVVTPGLQYGGGVPTVALFLYRLLESTGRYEPSLVSLAVAARDPFSARLLTPSSWRHGVQVAAGTWRGLPIIHVGAFLSEFECQRFRPRRALTELLRSFDLIQVVAGTPAMGKTVARMQIPTCLFVATTIRRERASLLAETSGTRGLWLRVMTGINALSERRALRLVDHVFALSEYTQSQLSPIVPGEKLSLGWPGVDTDLFYPSSEQAGGGYILSVGRHGDPRKNVRLLLEAYRHLHEWLPNVPQLILVGEQPRSEDWARVVRWGIADHVKVQVNVKPESLASLYRQASVFVLPSNEEGLGIVILEAMASGLPVVSTRCGGPETCVVDGVTGYLTPVGDAEALARRMQVLLEDGALRQRMGQAGRRLVETRFSIQAAGRPFLEVYARILGGIRWLPSVGTWD